MQAFERGFRMLCTGPALHLFSATELERLVCGNPILDFAALQKSARYEGGYMAEHKVPANQIHRMKLVFALATRPCTAEQARGCSAC